MRDARRIFGTAGEVGSTPSALAITLYVDGAGVASPRRPVRIPVVLGAEGSRIGGFHVDGFVSVEAALGLARLLERASPLAWQQPQLTAREVAHA